MKNFANLHLSLERDLHEEDEIKALSEYFSMAAPAEAAWALFFLTGKSLKQLIKPAELKSFALRFCNYPEWLFKECSDVVGDLSETISLILPAAKEEVALSLDFWIEQRVLPLKQMSTEEQFENLSQSWSLIDGAERLVFNKILTGTYRSLVSIDLLLKALSIVHSIDPKVLALRLSREWTASAQLYDCFVSADSSDVAPQIPYPFVAAKFLAESDLSSIVDLADWQIQWNWDGIRAQLIKRAGVSSLWSDQNQLLNEYFPELMEEAKSLADGVVMEGFVLAWKDADVLPFNFLEQRITRKATSRKIQEEIPVIFMATDLLEHASVDIRFESYESRRGRLSDVLSSRGKMKSDDEFEQLKLFAPCQAQLSKVLRVSPVFGADSFDELKDLHSSAMQLKTLGLRLDHRLSSYSSTETERASLSWNVDPIKIDAVLYSAQPTLGRRTGLYNDYTMAIWNGDSLVSFARVNSGLSEEDALLVDAFVRENTIEKYGPVRVVKPELVFELSVDRVHKSARYKSGIVARGATVLSLKKGADPKQAESLERLLSSL